MQRGPLAKSDMPDLPKPKYGEPCNHCGQCCMRSLCVVAQALRPDLPKKGVPCPYIHRDGNKVLCKVMLVEQKRGGKYVQLRLAAGAGCSLQDWDTTDVQVAALQKRAEAAGARWVARQKSVPDDDYLKAFL